MYCFWQNTLTYLQVKMKVIYIYVFVLNILSIRKAFQTKNQVSIFSWLLLDLSKHAFKCTQVDMLGEVSESV